MKYGLIFIIALSASLTASAGFLDKVSKAAGTLNKVAEGNVGSFMGAELKDGSKMSKEQFMSKNDFSEKEYEQWRGGVVKSLSESGGMSGGWKAMSGLAADGIVLAEKRVKLPADESAKIFRVLESGGVMFASDYAYFLSSDKTSLFKFNYPTVTDKNFHIERFGVSDSDALRAVSRIKNFGSAEKKEIEKAKYQETRRIAGEMQKEKKAAQKIAEQKEEEALAAEKIQKEEENKKLLHELGAKRSGVVAYSSKGLQWGDSEKIVNLVWPEVYFEEINRLGLRALRAGSVDDGEKSVRVLVDPEVGLFQLDITFAIRMFGMGGSVTVDDLKRKYVGKYGAPGVKKNEGGEVVSYRWASENEVVILQTLPLRIKLTNPALTQKLEEADRKRAEEAEKKRKSSAADVLDF